mmetsp:Transcript_34992/g.84603  ORF Transcript_34992/g.84603 Transcript_34992/m.84603 type:complete len:276 (-) Transcript_34992:137-964(-)
MNPRGGFRNMLPPKLIGSIAVVKNGTSQVSGNFRRHMCPQCDKRFMTPSLLQKHLIVHSGEKPYSCCRCGKNFTEKGNMEKHITQVHENVRRFKCKYCPRTFQQNQQVKHHELYHIQGRPQFQCSICQKNYSTQNRLKDHTMGHMSGPEVDSVTCQICKKIFTTKWYLQRVHFKKVHNNPGSWKCKICHVNCTSSRSLSRHHTTYHPKEAIYECGVCGRPFTRKSNARVHEQIHGGEEAKRFGCDKCGKRFWQKNEVARHCCNHSRNSKRIQEKC